MPETKLTAETVAERFRERYKAITGVLDEWERAKAAFLVDVGLDCLEFVRAAVEPLPEHDLAGRKAARANAVRALEQQLPDVEGIGKPQVNRWIRWAGVVGIVEEAKGLKQTHLMALEKFFDQHEPSCTFRLKEPWKNKLDAVQSCVKLSVNGSARELEEALDKEAEFPQAQESPCQTQKPNGSERTSASSTTATPLDSSSRRPVSPQPQRPAPEPSRPAPKPLNGSSRGSSPALSSSSTASPTTSSPSSSQPSAKDLADQAFKLLQTPEILAGVFRRPWDPETLAAMADNLIRGLGERDEKGWLALAKMMHRLRPAVLFHFEEFADGDRYKLRRKEEPSVPSIEQLVPMGELVEA